MAESDVILAIGTEIGPTDYDWNEEGPATLNGSLIRVDIDPEQAMRGHRAACIIIADAAETARELLSLVPSKGSRDGAARSSRARTAIARDSLNLTYRASLAMLETVRQTLPDAVIVGDSAQPVYAASVAYEAERPRAFFCSATGFGTLGYALPAAIGAKIGQPDRPVICLIGDGGLQFSIGELASAVEAKTPIIILLWNNFGYGEIKSFMVSRQIQPIGVDIGTPDFVLLAKAFGAASERLEAPDDLARLLNEAASRNVPTLIEINEASYVEAQG
jgi:acetolactate synthase-1/2/3 large subunit